MWFEQMTGFRETPSNLAKYLTLQETPTESLLHNSLTGGVFHCGRFATPSLRQLRQQVETAAVVPAPTAPALRLREVVGDVQALHRSPANAGALFQVASQFNGLEMVSPSVTPEHGISGYQYDRTQGPACAIACGAGTVYRNYFVDVAAHMAADDSSSEYTASTQRTARGQTSTEQLDLLAPLHQALCQQLSRDVRVQGPLWRMQNGYVLIDAAELRQVSEHLTGLRQLERDQLAARLRIAMQWHSEVTLHRSNGEHATDPQPSADAATIHRVSQAYCSALPVAYNRHSADLWQPFAQLVLDAAYEATLAAAVINAQQTGNNTVFLTQLGGGAFGNRSDWIFTAIERALRLYQHFDLDVVMVSYGRASGEVARLIEKLGNSNTSC